MQDLCNTCMLQKVFGANWNTYTKLWSNGIIKISVLVLLKDTRKPL